MALKSWLPIQTNSHFSLANIPFGIISTKTSPTPRPAIAIGDFVLDLQAFAANGGFEALSSSELKTEVFSSSTLNAFAALGRPVHSAVRTYLQSLFTENTPHLAVLKDNEQQRKALIPLKDVTTHLPLEIGDYTDFFAGVNHAYNVGVLFRGPQNALQPNYNHLPVAYHSRASSVVISGTPIRRPWGQILLDPHAEPKIPTFTPCRRLDIELEMAAFVCTPNALGEQVGVNEAGKHIFGYVLMNDWSARDIQVWEYVPLGPFNAKNFGTTISAWVVLPDALEPFAVTSLENKTELQSYLKEENKENAYDVKLEVDLTTANGNTTTISRSNFRNLMWSFPQMLAHHTVSGCPMRVGDLLGSGTISGLDKDSYGSMLEQNQAGKQTIKLNGGEERKFLQDGDTVTIRGWTGADGAVVGFGDCVGLILPALELK